jgi:two-component system, cell cycle response regulator
MAENCFLKPNDSLVFDYVNQISTICTVLIDQQMVICNCNLAFQTMIGANSKPVGEKFATYLVTEDQKLIINPPEKGFQKMSFTLIGHNHAQNDMVGYVARADEGYLLFCERSWITEDKIFEEISQINNQLANMTRELNKKNIALEKANATINTLLRADALTGIANRRHFFEYFQKMHAHAVRHKTPLSLVMVDLDFYKAINDQYGHQVGDEVLVDFAQLLQNSCREEDLPARYGGEEFAILLVSTNATEAFTQAERVRSEIEKHEFGELKLKITASFGVASLQEGETMESLLKRSDQALYAAKSAGRNQVKTSTI